MAWGREGSGGMMGHDVHQIPQRVTLVHCHPGLETKELGYFCPGEGLGG